MKLRRTKPARKMQATARRIPSRAAEEYEEEPNMRLSSAFVVVLLLHVVAVGGIYAFNSIKARRASAADGPPLSQGAVAQPPITPAASSAEPLADENARVHQVQPGDTLEKIASEHRTTVAALEEANNLQNVAMLRIGQELRIPDPPPRHDSAPAPKNTAPADDGKKTVTHASGETYTVVKGDNPVAIARKFAVKYSDLLDLNRIDDPRKLQIGQILKIPEKRK
jgi:LysM repeat protein